MDNNKSDLEQDSNDSPSLIDNLGAVVNNGIQYSLNRASLAAAEAKLAAVTMVWMLVLAVFGLILICAVWTLICIALAQWMIVSALLTVPQALGAIALLNVLLLLAIALVLRSLAESISFTALDELDD